MGIDIVGLWPRRMLCIKPMHCRGRIGQGVSAWSGSGDDGRDCRVVGYSMAEADFAIWRRTNFWILPVDVLGISRKMKVFGTL